MTVKQDFYLAYAWYEAHKDLGFSVSWSEFFRLRRAYKEPQRFYHTWQHIYECVSFVNLHYGNQPGVVLALFYHDAVYDPASKTNEQDSALMWLRYADKLQIDRGFGVVPVINELILMTINHKVLPHQSYVFQIMNDADMHVFLCPDEHYLEYARNVWREYKAVGEAAYLKGRLDFLNNLDVEKIFLTHQARELVHHARANIDLEKTILMTSPEQILVKD